MNMVEERVKKKSQLPTVLAWASLLLAVVSLVLTAWVVASSPGGRADLAAFRLPLSSLGEGAIGMLFPILLSGASTILSLPLLRRPIGQRAVAVSLVSWLAIVAVLGADGFRFLF